MAEYRIHFVDRSESVFDAVALECDAEDAAIEEAHRLDVPCIGAGFDVWYQDRLVYKHRRQRRHPSSRRIPPR